MSMVKALGAIILFVIGIPIVIIGVALTFQSVVGGLIFTAMGAGVFYGGYFLWKSRFKTTTKLDQNKTRKSFALHQLHNDRRILQESAKILEETSNLDTMLSRYNLVIDVIDRTMKYDTDNQMEALRQEFIEAFPEKLDIVVSKEIERAEVLKTVKGKSDRFDKLTRQLKGAIVRCDKWGHAISEQIDRLQHQKELLKG